jgi:hypothetical protein
MFMCILIKRIYSFILRYYLFHGISPTKDTGVFELITLLGKGEIETRHLTFQNASGCI